MDVTFKSQDGTATLAGTLTLPRTGGPFPAAYLIPGGAPFDRDESIAGHKTFLVLSDYLTRNGFATLRVDDRGVGKSTGHKFTVPLNDLARDAIAGVSFLKKQSNINAERVGLIGHSLGAILAPIAAAESDDVAFVILMGGSGEPWMDYLAASHALDGEGTVQVNRKLSAIMNKMLRAEDGGTVQIKDVRDQWEAFIQTLPADEQTQARSFMNALVGMDSFLAARPLRDMLALDPVLSLSRVRCPILALAGERDPTAIMLPAIRAALETGGNKDLMVQTLPQLNHMFQTVKTEDYKETPAQWARIEETISPVALDTILTWLADRFIKK
jgi:hypothetical protein